MEILTYTWVLLASSTPWVSLASSCLIRLKVDLYPLLILYHQSFQEEAYSLSGDPFFECFRLGPSSDMCVVYVSARAMTWSGGRNKKGENRIQARNVVDLLMRMMSKPAHPKVDLTDWRVSLALINKRKDGNQKKWIEWTRKEVREDIAKWERRKGENRRRE